MALLPDPTTAFVDPFRTAKTLNINFFIHDPITGEAYSRDPRNIAKKAEAYLASTGIADTAYFGPEAEFYIFDNVRFDTTPNERLLPHRLRSRAPGTPAREDERQPRLQDRATRAATSRSPPTDHFADLRAEMVIELEQSGLAGRACAPRGRHRRPGRDQLPVRHAARRRRRPDEVQVHRQERRLAQRQDRDLHAEADLRRQRLGHARATSRCGRTASRCSTTRPATRGLSDIARYYIGGLLKHAPSLLAFTNPTVNSYHRLVPGFEAPVNLVYSPRNRSACVRIPITGTNPKAKRIEFRVPGPVGATRTSRSPRCCWPASTASRTRSSRPSRSTRTSTSCRRTRWPRSTQVPTSLGAVLDALEADHDFLPAGGVFTPDLIETWIDYKRTAEIAPVQLRPHPHEFELYYDIQLMGAPRNRPLTCSLTQPPAGFPTDSPGGGWRVPIHQVRPGRRTQPPSAPMEAATRAGPGHTGNSQRWLVPNPGKSCAGRLPSIGSPGLNRPG